MSEVTEIPIYFDADMVRAILDGKKTQTRRVIKNLPKLDDDYVWAVDDEATLYAKPLQPEINQATPFDKCPYGKVGDRLINSELNLPLEITDIRVERLQYISDADAKAESFESKYLFQQKWLNLYGWGSEKSWTSNPWVWVISFKVVEK